MPGVDSHRVGPVSVFTVGAELYNNSAAGMDLLQSLGVGFVRLDVNWGTVAPDSSSAHKPAIDARDPNAYPVMTRYDALIRGLAARHIGVDLALIGPPPRWAEGPGAPTPSTQPEWKPDARDYADWVQAVGTRYSGHFTPSGASRPLPRVDFWSVWNEPNIGTNLGPEVTHSGSAIEVAPKLYRDLLNGAWSSLQATGHGNDRILIGELAPAGVMTGAPGLFNAMAPLRFLRALYCVDANYQQLRGAQASQRGCPTTPAASAQFATQNPGLFKAPGFSVHPYSFTSLPPNVRIPNEPDYAELAAIPTVEATLDRLQRVYGSHKQFPIWSTEFGYLTNPPNPQYTVTPALAAYYLNWAEYITWQDPRLKSFDQFLIQDPPGSTVFATGLKNAAGQPKPTLDAFRMPLYLPVTRGVAKHPLLVWGDVRPAPGAALRTHRRQKVQLQFKAASGKDFSTIDTVPLSNPHGYFEVRQVFPSSGSVRLRWTYPNGQTVFSRIADVALR
ncbi:MAG TPA: hypothetical protein VHW96_17445 [Solirubrobacteraceae bacterium]|nr:hypothetical protein [Solirubrobacteraceae bacterium]